LELNANYFDAYVERGFAEIRLEEYRRVVSDFSAALDLRPSDESSYLFLAMRADSHYWLGHYPEAVADYTTAIELTPDNEHRALFYRLRGLNLVQLGNHQAFSDFKRCLELDPLGNAYFFVSDLPSLLIRTEAIKRNLE
jgi:tetratricopeptide (TPR) repeat protein